MPCFLEKDCVSNVRCKIEIGFTFNDSFVKVMVRLREKAGANLAVRCETDTAAVAAERPGHGSDDADLTNSVVEGEASGGFAGCIRGEIDEWAVCVESSDDFVHGDDGFGRPSA